MVEAGFTMFSALINPLLHTFAANAQSCSRSFLGLEAWFNYLPPSAFRSDCTIQNFDVLGANSGLLLIGLAILDDLIRVAGLIAVGYVIYGGFQYMISQGAPDATKKAQQTIINAVVGLAIAILSASIVTFIGTRLNGA